MSRPAPTDWRRSAITAGLALSVILSGGSLPVLEPAPDTFNAAPAEIPETPVTDWVSSKPTHSVLTNADAPGTKVTVSGTRPAEYANPPADGSAAVELPTAESTGTTASGEAGAGSFRSIPGNASGTWGVSGQMGAFTWEYPITPLEAPYGSTPGMALSYDSSRVDGLTSATNNQASPVGDGWSLSGAGQIRQTFTPCNDQGIEDSYDLCGAENGQELTVSFGSTSGTLIKDVNSGRWSLESDDNTRIEYLTAAGTNETHDGGHWKLTTADGTQYFFGRNKLPGWAEGKPTTNSVSSVPVAGAKTGQTCHNADFSASFCTQAWAWNLDHVVDTNGNAQTFYYAESTNSYSSQAGAGKIRTYDRSSELTRVEYGIRTGSELTASAPKRLQLAYADRCVGIDCTAGTDVPTKYACPEAGPCTRYSPTFYSSKRLSKITTEALHGTAYVPADAWSLEHTMPNPGDGTAPALWLGGITYQGLNTTTGTGAAISVPKVTFAGQTLQNRVWVLDGLAPLNRFRITSIKTVTGAVTTVAYNGAECSPQNLPATPETNTKRCYPQWWAPTEPIAQEPRMDYFHIYPVRSVATSPGPGGEGSENLLSRYEYLGSPAWKYADDKYQAETGGSQTTWSQGAGWEKVKSITGAAGAPTQNAATITTYLRGLNGTPANKTGGLRTDQVTATDGTSVTDSPWFAGVILEEQQLLGETGAVVSTSISTPWASAPTATDRNGATARHLGTSKTLTKELLGNGTWRSSQTLSTFSPQGLTTSVSNLADTSVPGDDTCTVTVYAENTAANILALPAGTTTHEGPCSDTGTATGPTLASKRHLYDSSTAALPGTPGYAAPVKGNQVRSDVAKKTDGASPEWITGPTTSYDAMGRAVKQVDNATGTLRTSTTSFSPETGSPVSVTNTNTLGWSDSSTLDVVRGLEMSSTDVNGHLTTHQYDALGRPTAAWSPNRPQATNPVPTTAYEYGTSDTAPSWVKETSVGNNGEALSSYAIYDGLGRPRQTQHWSPTGGTIATDTFYNAVGQVRLDRAKYYFSTDPSTTLKMPTIAVPSSQEMLYDGLGRVVETRKLANDNQLQWSTKVAYDGADTTTVTGPGSESATRTVTDARGNVVQRIVYKGTTPTGAADVTTYAFDRANRMVSMTDPAGNLSSWAFDAAGRTISSTDPDAGTTTTAYDDAARILSVQDPAGKTDYTYDQLDRVLEENVSAAGSAPRTLVRNVYDTVKKAQLSSSTRFNGPGFDQAHTSSITAYDALYNPTAYSETLPAVLGAFAGTYASTATYGLIGDIKQENSPAVGPLPAESLRYSYDSADRPIGVMNQLRDSIVTNVQYNNLGWMAGYEQADVQSSNTSATTTAGRNNTYFTWDATTGRITQQASKNITKTVTSDLGTTTYQYSEAGKLVSRGLSHTTRQGALGYFDNECFGYDYAGRLSSVWTPGTGACTGGFTATGLGGLAPYAHTYTYNSTGDRTAVKRFAANGTTSSTETYTYGTPGGPGPHQLRSVATLSPAGATTTSTLEWGDGGRLTNRAGQTITYGPDGRINTTSGTSSIAQNPNPGAPAAPAPATADAGAPTQRIHNAAGDLVGLIDGTGITAVIGNATAHAPKTGAKTATRSYDFVGKTVAQRTAITDTAGAVSLTLSYLIPDRVGTGQTLVSPMVPGATGVRVTQRYVDPMGMLRGPPRSATANGTYTNTPASGIGTASNQASSTGFGAVNGYTGALDDAATDLTHLGARDLDPVLGIFTAPDPLMTTAPRHSSPYTYASGDPVNLQDTTGLRADSAGGGGGGGSGVGGRPIKYGSKDGWAGKPARYKTTPVRSSGRGDSLRMGGAIRGAIRHTVHYQHEPTPQFGYAVPPSSPGSWSGFSAGNWSGTSYGGWTGNYGYAPVANGYGGYSVGGSGSAWYGAPTPLPGQAAPLAAARPTYESSAAQYAKSQQATADLGNSALSSVSSIQQNYRNGKAAEQSVMNMHPGSSGASFPTTPAFGRRFIDVLTEEGTAIEVKVGYTRLSKFVENQIAKDVYLRSQGEANLNDIQSVEWWFARSPRTSLIGPSPKLAEALRKANIEIKTF